MFNVKVRRSQLLSPFGVGAILDLPEEALMLMGLEQWDTAPSTIIQDERLAARLRVSRFHEPIRAVQETEYGPQDTEGGSTLFTRFPRWYYCPRCREMAEAHISQKSPPTCTGQYKPCFDPNPDVRRPMRLMVPVRFAVACEDGHIDDFPWIRWAHFSGSICENPRIRLLQTQGAGLAGLKVVCENETCKELGVTLSAAGRKDAFVERGCSGHRPWLGFRNSVSEECERVPQLIQRGASNAYFARIVTSILIPPFSKRLFRILESNLFYEYLTVAGTQDGGIPDSVFEMTARKTGVSAEDLKAAYESKLNEQEKLQSAEITEESFRFAEFEAFNGKDLGASQDELRLRKSDLSETSEAFRKTIDSLVLIDKLVETRCLTGFTRLDPNARLASLSKSHMNWLPAIAGTGEGIFVNFNSVQLGEWSRRPDVIERVSIIWERTGGYGLAIRRSGTMITPEFVMIHSLAHVLNRRLSFDCGYGSSSIRERIYSSTDSEMQGLLIYTSEAGNEGTLGGLVMMGEPLRFEETLAEALNDSAFCSNDPLCEESSGQGPGSVNLAACQGCCLVPETSCEEGNFFLDRVLLTGTAENPELGFFSPFFR